MKTLQPFIDLGWHTVPLKGELRRLSNGKKTIPRYPIDWKAHYTKELNTEASIIGGVITGAASGIMVIDCDNTATYDIFKSLDPDYALHFISLGKKDGLGVDQSAGSIVYKYNEIISDSFKLHNNTMSLDFLSDGGFAYLPTEGNETKIACEAKEFKELKEAPTAILALLESLRPIRITAETTVLTKKAWAHHLQPQVNKFVQSKKIIPELFKILTPKDYRLQPEYLEKGYLHPDDIPEGGGSDYLMKVSAILGADESIDADMYLSAMKIINDMFSQPMKTTRLSSTIMEPMVEERSSISGEPIWRYNEEWQDGKLTLITKRNAIIEAFFDPQRAMYYLADIAGESVHTFNRDTDFISYTEAVAVEVPSKKEFKVRMPLIDAVSSPEYPFGFFSSKSRERAFNSFVPTTALSIFKNPSSYTKLYSRPTTTIKYLETFIPDNYMRNYLLKFLRRKFDKFEYSPTILYFIGKPGSGKDTLVNLIERMIGSDSIARPTCKEFLEMYNGWMVDKYFTQLDEYGDQLVRFDDKEIAKGKIKAYTGKPQVQIRAMRTNGYQYMHYITFMMTANRNPLYIEEDDRRIALFDCPNVLKDADWVHTSGGISVVIDQIIAETNDFAYYLATEIDNLSRDDYTSPPDTQDKKNLIASKFAPAHRLAFLLASGLFEEVEQLAHEYGQMDLMAGSHEGRVYEDSLFELYQEMTDGNGHKRGLNVAMKEFDKIPTTREGMKSYYYYLPNLKGYKRKLFSSIEEDDVGIDLGD